MEPIDDLLDWKDDDVYMCNLSVAGSRFSSSDSDSLLFSATHSGEVHLGVWSPTSPLPPDSAGLTFSFFSEVVCCWFSTCSSFLNTGNIANSFSVEGDGEADNDNNSGDILEGATGIEEFKSSLIGCLW
jgi:hypothetical protein